MPNAMVVDLSHHNTNVDFGRARAAGVVGVIHKATQGTGFVDNQYLARKPLAIAAGLLWGAYHFGTSADVDAQVRNFVGATRPDGSFLLALDFEKNDPSPGDSMSLQQAKDFLTKLEQQTGQRPILYTSRGYINDTVGPSPDPDLAPYKVWWARYADTPGLHPTWPGYWLWQHTDGVNGPDTRSVDGIGNCDCNTYDKSEADLRTEWLS